MKQRTIEKKQLQKEERAEDRRSRKAFNYLIRMAKSKGALVEVSYSNTTKTTSL